MSNQCEHGRLARQCEICELHEMTERAEKAEWFINSRGYRRCDIPACNCPYWHGGHLEERLREIDEAVEPDNGETILTAVQRAVKERDELRALVQEHIGLVCPHCDPCIGAQDEARRLGVVK